MRTLARLIIIRWLLRIFSIRVVYSPLKSEPTFENVACHHCPRLPKAWPLAQLVIRNIRKGHLYTFVLYSQCRSEPTIQNVENIYSRFFFFEKYIYSFSMINVGVTLSTQQTFLFFKISFFLVEIIGEGSAFYCTRMRFEKRTCSAKVRKTNLRCQVCQKKDNRKISADNLRRKFLIFLCKPGSARFAEKNKEFS